MKTISKTEAAKRWGVAPSMVTKYVKRGMPVTSSGRINWAAAQEWRRNNIIPERSGSFAARQCQAHRETEPAGNGGGSASRAACRRLMDSILSRRNLVPRILAECGVRDPVLLHCVDDLFAELVCGLASGLEGTAYDWDCDDIPAVKTNIQTVFDKYNLELTPDVITAADKMADAVFEAAKRAVKGTRCEL